MASLVSVRLSDDLFQNMRIKAHILNLSQTEYIRKAIENMNIETQRREQAQRLKQASLRVRKESMKVNAEFGGIEHDPKD
jgi:predicted transcriptional regulator